MCASLSLPAACTLPLQASMTWQLIAYRVSASPASSGLIPLHCQPCGACNWSLLVGWMSARLI